jgi:tetratricopeptide (TPR) repeat protein
MKYDRLGFPIPQEFDLPADPGRRGPAPPPDARDSFGNAGRDREPPRTAGPLKRLLLLAVLLLAVVPAVVVPFVLPLFRDAVVQWSLERAAAREARGDVAAAAAHVGRAIDWVEDDVQGRCKLLCWRAMLLLEDGDPAAAVAEAGRAVTLVPTAAHPHRTRAIAHVVAGDPDAALADAQSAVELSGDGNPEALNHRAYIRALVGRDLPAALADIEAALAGSGAGSPEFLDTRGFIFHLLDRNQEAIDDLNQAIAKTEQTRRQLVALAGRADPEEVAYRLRSLDHGLAVMHHHRGLACDAAGLERQARQDFEVAKRKGFDPQKGVL